MQEDCTKRNAANRQEADTKGRGVPWFEVEKSSCDRKWYHVMDQQNQKRNCECETTSSSYRSQYHSLSVWEQEFNSGGRQKNSKDIKYKCENLLEHRKVLMWVSFSFYKVICMKTILWVGGFPYWEYTMLSDRHWWTRIRCSIQLIYSFCGSSW